jgi:hypothetical protein
MKVIFTLTTVVYLSLNVLFVNAQSAAPSKKQLDEFKKLNAKLTEEKDALSKSLADTKELLSQELVNNKNFASYVKRLTAENKLIQSEFEQKDAKIKVFSENLLSAEDKIAKLQYEMEILKDSKITQIYDEPVEAVKAKFIERMGAKDANFQFDESEVNNFTISKTLDGTTEVWFDFDKASNILLEMKAKFEAHKFDKNRTLVSISTNLLEKGRYSNKQFAATTDTEKVKLYNKKMVQLLEGDLKHSK